MKNYFLTFGGSSDPQKNHMYKHRLQEVINQAYQFQLFNEIHAYNNDDLKNDSEFWSKHGDFILKNGRGYGYWIWKSYLTRKTLMQMNEGDVLVYADVGCTLNIHGRNRMIEYIQYVNQNKSGVLCFDMPYNGFHEYNWTKNDLLEYLNADESISSSHQRIGTAFIIRKNSVSVDFINRWYEVSCIYHFIDDTPSISNNHIEFKEHRHDQSVFSCLSKQYGIPAIKDETWFHPNWMTGIMYPIWATRLRPEFTK